jgi:hypothetical protein
MTKQKVQFASFLLLFTAILSTDYVLSVPTSFPKVNLFREQFLSSVYSQSICSWVIPCLCVYIFGLAVRLRWLGRLSATGRPNSNRFVDNARMICLLMFLSAALVDWSRNYSKTGSSDLLVLLCGITLAHIILWLKMEQGDSTWALGIHMNVVNSLIVIFTFAVFLQPQCWEEFFYRGHRRWHGPWWNPNHFGLLIGSGLVLTVGQIFQYLGLLSTVSGRITVRPQYRRVGVYLLAACCMGFALIKSYSRGAWIGTVIALIYFGVEATSLSRRAARVVEAFGSCAGRGANWLFWGPRAMRNRITLGIAIISLLALCFWNYRHARTPEVRRILSVGNPNDFSWRFRLVAYEGALQMMLSRPLGGFGWGEAETAYGSFFQPSDLLESKVILLNDYFMVGITLGLPALVCFTIYIGLTWISNSSAKNKWSKGTMPNYYCGREEWLHASSRAAVIVFLVGFWLDRGIFWLALTVPFWVLLELGGPSCLVGPWPHSEVNPGGPA